VAMLIPSPGSRRSQGREKGSGHVVAARGRSVRRDAQRVGGAPSAPDRHDELPPVISVSISPPDRLLRVDLDERRAALEFFAPLPAGRAVTVQPPTLVPARLPSPSNWPARSKAAREELTRVDGGGLVGRYDRPAHGASHPAAHQQEEQPPTCTTRSRPRRRPDEVRARSAASAPDNGS
jgi:hypothetical protein